MINRMSIREFLSMVIAAIVKGDVLNDPSVAEAIEQFGDHPSTEMGNPDKIAFAVSSAREILRHDFKANLSKITADGDALVGFMCKHFDAATATAVEAGLVIHRPDLLGVDTQTLNEVELARLAEGVVPIAIFKSLFKHRTPFNLTKMPNFVVFAQLYRRPLAGRTAEEMDQLAARLQEPVASSATVEVPQ